MLTCYILYPIVVLLFDCYSAIAVLMVCAFDSPNLLVSHTKIGGPNFTAVTNTARHDSLRNDMVSDVQATNFRIGLFNNAAPFVSCPKRSSCLD